MKKFIPYGLVLLVFQLFSGCNNPAGNQTTYTISGTVVYAGMAKQDVKVSIDDAINWTTKTDETGFFEIKDVIEGNHSLKATTEEGDKQFSERNYSIEVYNDFNFSELILPRAIEIEEPLGVSANSIQLKWMVSDAPDFKEYKLFRHSSSGLDENTGTLIHVFTSILDTTFIDNSVSPITQYFYRIYVMNEFGRLGGSNIVSFTTENAELIINGSFEEIDSNSEFPVSWAVWNNAPFVVIDTNIVFHGNVSLRADVNEQTANHRPLYQLIDPSLFQQGERYRLSYWIKASEMVSNQPGYYTFLRDDNWTWTLFLNRVVGPQPVKDWTLTTYDFTYPADISTSNIRLEFYYEGSPEFQVWIDQVSIKKI